MPSRWSRLLSAVLQVRDPILGIAVTVLYAVELHQWGPSDPASTLLITALGGIGLALRRRLPIVGFILSAASIRGVTATEPGFDNDSLALIVTLVVALFSLGRHAVGPERWLGAGAVVVFAVLFVVDDPAPGADPGDVGFAAVFLGAPWAVGLVLALRQERERVLTSHNVELQRDLEAHAREAVAAERARIARELHDVVSHAIAVTVLQARGARKMLGVDEETVRRALDAIELTNTQALSDMRRLLSLLRDAEDGPQLGAQLGPQPSLQHLDLLVDKVRSSGLPVELEVTGDRVEVPPGVDLSAYRIVQEALTNVLKHAGAGATAKVDVSYGGDALDIAVVDDGQVRSNGGGRGHGLLGIRERVSVVGGRVDAGPTGSGGFAVRARLPYEVQT